MSKKTRRRLDAQLKAKVALEALRDEAPIVKLGDARVPMPGGLLHVLELRAIFERGGDKGRPHRMRRVAE